MIRQRKDRDGLQVQVYAGRDPLTGRKRYVSCQIPGSGRAAMKQAKQIEAQLMAEVGAGRQQRSVSRGSVWRAVRRSRTVMHGSYVKRAVGEAEAA